MTHSVEASLSKMKANVSLSEEQETQLKICLMNYYNARQIALQESDREEMFQRLKQARDEFIALRDNILSQEPVQQSEQDIEVVESEEEIIDETND